MKKEPSTTCQLCRRKEAEIDGCCRSCDGTRQLVRLTVKAAVRAFGADECFIYAADRKDHKTARVRHIVWSVVRDFSTLSYPQIAWLFGLKDHTTVLYGIRKARYLYVKEINQLKGHMNVKYIPSNDRRTNAGSYKRRSAPPVQWEVV